MKLLTYENKASPRSGHRLGLLWPGGAVIDLAQAAMAMNLRSLPVSVLEFIEGGTLTRDTAEEIVSRADEFGGKATPFVLSAAQVRFKPPLPLPPSLRHFQGFIEPIEALCAADGRSIPPEWHEAPVFEFGNHHAVLGPDDAVGTPSPSQALDFEPGVACVVARAGSNIPRPNAARFLFGYALVIQWVLRDVQRRERAIGSGAAKSKDFAISMGPCVTTRDELQAIQDGDTLRLDVTVSVNGRALANANLAGMRWTFAQMVESASRGTPLFPGDVLTSGSLPGASLFSSGRPRQGWLKSGDVVEVAAAPLGALRVRVQ
jgi:2-keto-4-pentenoate hydratase/2-oxohepta-3-ene-1,7-dioic acid hydratase in catechol pathway